VTQQARQLAWSLSDRPTQLRCLIHDRDSKFSAGFDAVFRSESLEIIRTHQLKRLDRLGGIVHEYSLAA